MVDPAGNHDLFFHVRVLFGIVVSLGVARLLGGFARFIQHPGRQRLYWVQIAWALSLLLLMLLLFWWADFRLAQTKWTFHSYAFVIAYASVFYLLCSIVFPDDLGEFGSHREYFLSRRRWFFGLLACAFALDVADTLLKGPDYAARLGAEYPIRIGVYMALSIVACFTANERFHKGFAIANVAYQLSWILRDYDTMR